MSFKGPIARVEDLIVSVARACASHRQVVVDRLVGSTGVVSQPVFARIRFVGTSLLSGTPFSWKPVTAVPHTPPRRVSPGNRDEAGPVWAARAVVCVPAYSVVSCLRAAVDAEGVPQSQQREGVFLRAAWPCRRGALAPPAVLEVGGRLPQPGPVAGLYSILRNTYMCKRREGGGGIVGRWLGRWLGGVVDAACQCRLPTVALGIGVSVISAGCARSVRAPGQMGRVWASTIASVREWWHRKAGARAGLVQVQRQSDTRSERREGEGKGERGEWRSGTPPSAAMRGQWGCRQLNPGSQRGPLNSPDSSHSGEQPRARIAMRCAGGDSKDQRESYSRTPYPRILRSCPLILHWPPPTALPLLPLFSSLPDRRCLPRRPALENRALVRRLHHIGHLPPPSGSADQETKTPRRGFSHSGFPRDATGQSLSAMFLSRRLFVWLAPHPGAASIGPPLAGKKLPTATSSQTEQGQQNRKIHTETEYGVRGL